jgi:hypothetical protein
MTSPEEGKSYARTKHPIARISEVRQDEALLVETADAGSSNQRERWEGVLQGTDSFRACYEVDQSDVLGPGLLRCERTRRPAEGQASHRAGRG